MKKTILASALAIITATTSYQAAAGDCQMGGYHKKAYKQSAMYDKGMHSGYGYGGYHKKHHGGYGKQYGAMNKSYGSKAAYGNAYGGANEAEQSTAAASTAAAASADANDIVAKAIAAGNFTTLVDAVKAAGLVDTLKGEGPFTVFAPSDEAFAKIPGSILTAIVADKKALTELLTAHVVSGELKAAEVTGNQALVSLQGSTLAVDTTDGVKVGGANVVSTDIIAENGVIHVIDSVILPN